MENEGEVLIATHEELESKTKTGVAHATAKGWEQAASEVMEKWPYR